MKKLIILICLTLSIAANAIERDEILKVYNWADYIDEELIPEFEKWYHAQTGKYIHVSYSTFDINESMLTEIEVGHEDYDVVCPSEYHRENAPKGTSTAHQQAIGAIYRHTDVV